MTAPRAAASTAAALLLPLCHGQPSFSAAASTAAALNNDSHDSPRSDITIGDYAEFPYISVVAADKRSRLLH
eukprot:1558256-Prymnesium_polylepis.2